MANASDHAAFNAFIASRSYVEGYQFSDADVASFQAMGGAPDATEHPHAFRWFVHIAALTRSVGAAPAAGAVAPPAAPAASSGGKKGKKGKKGKNAAPAPAPAAEDDDDFDVFGDDDEDDAAAAAEALAKRRADAAAKKKGSAKPAKIERSQCVFEIKPADIDVDLDALAAEIRATIVIDGLSWGEQHSKVDVAFGIQKLIMSCVVVDDKVGMDDVSEPIEAMEDKVQSVDLATMNRL